MVYKHQFLRMNCTPNFIVITIIEETRGHC